MELNHILLFTAIATSALVVLQAFRPQRLGELDPHSVIFRHQYWRLLTALFLHYGPIHIFFNLFALLLLGPALERQIGGFLFAVCYLVSGIGSSVAVVLLTKLRLFEPVQL